ncbi:MAG: acyl-CoA dehydrogenase family protein [Myxococcota bacterium]
MDLEFSEEQQMLREMVRALCAELVPLDVVRKLEDDPIGYSADFWKQLGELGLIGLTLPERYGGGAQSALEAAILYEELGRALAPSPHFVSSVLCAGALLEAGSDAQKAEWLPRIASGEAILTPAWLEPRNGYGPRGVQLRATREGASYVITGTKLHVPFAQAASRLLVLVRSGDAKSDVDLLLVDPRARGVCMTQLFTLASDSQYRVDFEDVQVPESDRIDAAGSGWSTWERAMREGLICLAAQAIGGAERALEMTVQYARERKQFEKPLGAFQAIAHYLADAATELDGGRTLVHQAAWARARGRPHDRLASMAKLFACDVFRKLTATAQQIFGGVGFTIEYDIQLYFRRAKQLQLSWWDPPYLEELIARSVLDSAD